MARKTLDRQQLVDKGDRGQFALELRELLKAWKLRKERQNGLLDIQDVAFAETIGIAKSSLSRFMNGDGMPDFDICKAMAHELGVTEDYLLALARRPNFSEFMRRVESAQGFAKWEDGATIMRMLRETQQQHWLTSQSFWKSYAEATLRDEWNNKDIHAAAHAVASIILAWVLDRQRETPFQARAKEAFVS